MTNQLSIQNAVQIIQSRIQVNAPGKHRVKVTNVTPYVREDGTAVNICNLAAMTPYHQAQAKAYLAAGDTQSATNQNLTSSPRQGRDYTPSKGEFVDIMVGFVETKNGEQALLVTSMSAVPLEQSTNVKGFEAFLAKEVAAPVFAQEGVEA